jgi:hypothetical protein
MEIKLPTTLRGDRKHRGIVPGLDVPAWFYHSIKSIDKDLHFVYHRYKVMYEEPVTNCYVGSLEDPRFHIHEEYGEELWGYPSKQNNSDDPIFDNTWHLWRLCWPYGWAHVVGMESLDPEYLKILERRMYLQAMLSDKYDARAYARMNEQEREDAIARQQAQSEDLYNEVQKENAWLMNKAAENFQRGITAPTNPKKEIITSYSGQGNRSKIVRNLTDEEGGIILPDRM